MVAEDLHGGLGVGVEGRLELELRDADALEERLHRHTRGGESDSTWPIIYSHSQGRGIRLHVANTL